MIDRNDFRGESDSTAGVARSGKGLLSGLLRCGRCGRKLYVRYRGKAGTAGRYLCHGTLGTDGGPYCLGFGGATVDRRFEAEVPRALSPLLYQIEWPSDEATGTLALQFIDRNTGTVVDHFDIEDLTGYTSPIRWHSFLPIGSYVFEVTKNGGLHQREEFEVTSLDPERAPKIGVE